MSSLIRPRLFAVAALLAVLGGAWQYLGSANADDRTTTANSDPFATSTSNKKHKPAKRQGAHDLILGSKDSAQPQNMEQFLTAVTKDVDAYWTKVFKDSGLPEPRVSYTWIPAGQTAASACGDDERHAGRQRRRVLPGRRHDLHLAEVRDRHLQRRARPGAARQLAGLRPDGRRLRGRLHRRARVRPRGPGRARPLREVRPAAPDDGVRAPGRLLRRHVGQERLRGEPSRGRRRAGGAGRRPRRRRLRREQPEPPRHARAARGGLEHAASRRATRPSCNTYLDPANLGDGSAAPQQDPGTGYPQEQDPGNGDPQQQDPGNGDPQQQEPSYPQDDTGSGYPQQDPADQPYGVAAARS